MHWDPLNTQHPDLRNADRTAKPLLHLRTP
jgi:hypothetical protein